MSGALHAQTGIALACFRHLARLKARAARWRQGVSLGCAARSRKVQMCRFWTPKVGRNGGNFACRLWRGQRF